MTDADSEIASFYRNRSIFITGASGFIGKVLLEKLLRSCPGIANIYVLIRPKRGNDVKTRIEEILNTKLFDLLRRERPSALMKVIPIIGDITQPGLGISASDLTILQENVSIVFHSAATVRFDEPLKLAASLNILGTKKIIEISRKMTQLVALIHVSTAYCNCHQKELEEILYAPPADPEKVIDWLQWMDEDVVNEMTPKIVGKRPNTYTYTKALAEHLFHDMAADLPAAIVRPSIVTASVREPVPGWVDNLNGPTGLLAGIGKGVLRSILCDEKLITDMIPVDVLTNLMISVAWRTATNRSNNMMIYNCTSSTVNPIKWRLFIDVIGKYMISNPYKEVLWYPGGTMKTSRFLHQLDVHLNHIIPAYIFDAIATICGKKPSFVKLQQKMWRAVKPLEFFTTHEWSFSSRNTTYLYTQLSEKDRETFNFDITQIEWKDYLVTYFEGIRKHILKENEKDSSNFMKMYYLHKATQLVTFVLMLKIARMGAPSFRRLFYSMLNVTLYTAKFLTFKT